MANGAAQGAADTVRPLRQINEQGGVGVEHTAMSDHDLIARYDGRVPRYTSYPTAPHFQGDVGPTKYLRWLGELTPQTPISLYLHVPFCERLCLYCGCTTAVVRQEAPRVAYAELLKAELRMVAGALRHRGRVSHIHWGGGTPTALPPAAMLEIMALARELFTVPADAELAIEIDPTTLTTAHLVALAEMGLTRASIGVQDFDIDVQNAIGRRQSFEVTQSCVLALRQIGVSSLNLDLIYGLPKQTVQGVKRTARQAQALNADRVAVFGYAHVPWMKRHQRLINEADLPDARQRFAQRAATAEVLEEGGYVAVGLDHYARPVDSLAVAMHEGALHRSFQGYTTDDAPALLGLGASAIGCLPQGYAQNAPTAVAYAAAINGGQPAVVRGIALSADDRLRGELIERIMCDLSADIPQLAAAHGADPAPLLLAANSLDRFAQDALVRWDGRRVEVTEAGRPFVRNVAALFDAYLPTNDTQPRHSSAI